MNRNLKFIEKLDAIVYNDFVRKNNEFYPIKV